jgi:hypothetical protein
MQGILAYMQAILVAIPSGGGAPSSLPPSLTLHIHRVVVCHRLEFAQKLTVARIYKFNYNFPEMG